MRLEPLLKPEFVLILPRSRDREEVLRDLARRAAAVLPRTTSDSIYLALLERERRRATSTPEGVAFPHAVLDSIDRTLLFVALLRPGVSFSGQSCDVVFALFGHSSAPMDHVRLLARLARLARAEGALERLRAAETESALYQTLLTEDRTQM